MTQKSVKRYVALGGGVALVAAVVTAYALSRPLNQAGSQPALTAPAPTVASRGSNRGGGTAKVSLPADLPLPTGTLTGASGTSPAWSVGLNIDGDYAAVMPAIRAFYVSHGFTDLNANQAIPFGFKNVSYSLQIVGRNHDHTGPASTDVTIVVHKN